MRFTVALTPTLALAFAASAVIIDTDDGTGNLTAPMPYVSHVGRRGSLSAVYLGDGTVLTANHVGAGDVVIEGIVYPWIPGSALRLQNEDGSDTDLLLFAIEPRPGLESLPIAETPPPYGSFLVTSGNGRNRGGATAWDPNGPYPPELTEGYYWAAGHSLRWGTNSIEVFPPGRVFGTEAFGSLFQPGAVGYEAQAVPGDSGGAAFAWRPESSDFALAGLMIAIVQYSGQPSGTTFYGQTTYYADLAWYRDDILDAMAMPEPGGGLPAGAALLAALRGRPRRRRARASRDQLPHQSRLRSSETASASVPCSPSG